VWNAGLVVGVLSYGFSVPDESRARQLASALADFGFPQVSAGPGRKGGAGTITQAADEYHGTQAGEFFLLVRRLIDGDAAEALSSAMAIACWFEAELLTRWIDDDSIAAGPRALQILSEAIPHATYRYSSG
jgi:hypothetical protein